MGHLLNYGAGNGPCQAKQWCSVFAVLPSLLVSGDFPEFGVMEFFKWKKPPQLYRVGFERRRISRGGEASAACLLRLLFGILADLTSSLSLEEAGRC